MNDVIDCFVNSINVCIHRDGCNIGEQLHGVGVDLGVRIRVVTLEAPIVFQAWSNVPSFDSVVVPGAADFCFSVDDDFSTRRGKRGLVKIKVAEEISVGGKFWVDPGCTE